MLKYILPILVVSTVSTVFGLFESCDNTYTLYGGEVRQVNSPYYPQYMYPPGSSCRYHITAPTGYELNVKCYISLPTQIDSSCYSDYFYIGRDGNKTLTGSEFFCGSGYIERTSLFTSVVLAYVSSTTTQSGYFQCNVTARVQPCDCGWSVNSKIVGGSAAGPNEFISMAGIVYRPQSLIFDGGSIISNRYVLSAAHGLNPYLSQLSSLGVLIGDHDISTGVETPYSALLNVETIMIHEYFNSQSNANDIALIKTTTDITYSRGVGPACLPYAYRSSGADFTNVPLQAAGWGTTSYGGPTSDILQTVSLTVTSNAQCSASWGTTILATQICTYTPNKDTCQYDSGGGLYYPSNRLNLIGIISYGYSCASNVPSVNTRVTSYISWIESKTPGVSYCVK